jgi:hypothetical protein
VRLTSQFPMSCPGQVGFGAGLDELVVQGKVVVLVVTGRTLDVLTARDVV